MRAIAVKEIGSYYNTMTGYVYMAICLLVCGIFFAAENISGGSASFLGVVNAISYVLILITPILTMKSFAEERKSKTFSFMPLPENRRLPGKKVRLYSEILLWKKACECWKNGIMWNSLLKTIV